MAVAIPLYLTSPIKIVGADFTAEVKVPLATLEKPVVHTVNRGARVTRKSGGIKVTLLKNNMTRAILVEAESATRAAAIAADLKEQRHEFQRLTATTSSVAVFQDFFVEIVGNLLYVRFAFEVGDAAGHNMTTKASEAILDWLLVKYSDLKYVSLSANLCVDKKVSAINSILGRGKHLIAEVVIPADICHDMLHVAPQVVVALNNKKNLLGSILAGSLRSANAHFANMLLAFYLATGQDGANIVEGSQGITYAALQDEALYFSVNLPNIIVGTVGAGKDLAYVQDNLALLGCLEKRPQGKNAERLAKIAAATVLCGELSLLAALTNRGELMASHERLER